MPPQQETSHLLPFSQRQESSSDDTATEKGRRSPSSSSVRKWLVAAAIALGVFFCLIVAKTMFGDSNKKATGPYQLLEVHKGESFFHFYDFFDGPDSLGSAGYNTYVSHQRAKELGIVNVTKTDDDLQGDYVFMGSSRPAEKGPRESIRLEGKTRFNRGLFVLDISHMPAGCGVWPAFWLTDEDHWPDNGEIDIVEGVNNQNVAKTALHTSAACNMYAHVPSWAKTGIWDWATGLPDTFTGIPQYNISKPADDCWNMAPHQWLNQGCVQMHKDPHTIGEPLNQNGGGVYVLEWDPDNHYIKSWVFTPRDTIPDNLADAMATAGQSGDAVVVPDPTSWDLPYAYFAIGDTTGCSADHFKNMRIVFNLAFCGTVAGNRFTRDCPDLAKKFNVSGDPVLTCNAYIESNPDILSEAYWKVNGVYVYERELEAAK